LTSSTPEEPLEREIKVQVGDLEPVRQRLLELGAALDQPACLERNWVLDRRGSLPAAGVELLATGQLLRLREDGRGACLTYKGPARFEGGSGTVRVRAEREVALSDAGEALAILLALGYEVVRRYEKQREEWILEGVVEAVVALDDTPLGAFVEVEGAEAEDVARELGLDPARAVRRSYLALWEEHRRSHPEAGRDMVFAPGASPAGED
jgi:predicted adenylyl cyclase CyaB